MEEQKDKESFLYKKLDLGFVYIFIFLVGFAIVLFMINYLNSKIQDYTGETTVAINNINCTFL